MQSLIDLLGLKGLIPHGYCLSWSPVLLWLNVITDLLMTLSFYSIPMMLVYFIRQRKDVPYSWLIAMIAGFIVACGTMHLLAVIMIWIPLYWLDGWFKGFTAIFSVATAVSMWRIIPRALSLPSAAQLQAEIQQRKTAEEALRAANVALQENVERTQMLVDSALDGMISMDRHGNITAWNSRAEHIFGYSAEQALGRELAGLIIPSAYREQHRRGLSRFMATGAASIIGTRLETMALHANASELPIELTVNALERQGEYSFSAYVRDITERKQMEEKLRNSDAFNASILNSLSSHIAVLDAQGVIVAVNDAWCQFARENGLSESGHDMVGCNYLDVCMCQSCGAEANDSLAGVMEVLGGELEIFHLEYPCHSLTEKRWFQMTALPLQGSQPGVVISHKNITERKKAEEIAQAASQYARSLIEASLDPLMTISATGKITDGNTAAEQVTGISRDSMVGSDFAAYFTDPEKARAGYQQVFSQGFVTDYPLAIRHVSGKVTDVLYNASVYRDDNGNVLGMFAAARDITEHKAMEDELKNSEAKFRLIIDVSPVPMALNDGQFNITFLNQEFVQTFGYTVDDIPTLADWWAKACPAPDYRHWAESNWQKTLAKAKQLQAGSPPMEVAIRCKDNSIKTVLLAAAVINHNGERLYLAVLYDITLRKQIEAELTRSNAELEQFAYAVSHDMRQPLRMVTSYLSLIENALIGQLDEETQQFLDFAVSGAKRMDAMILSLLDYSRVGRKFEAKTLLSSRDALDEALAFLNPELNACGGDIQVTGDWPELFASGDELTRLLQNLIGNALKYHEDHQPPQVQVHGTVSAGLLRVEVRDHGIGIEPSQMNRLFKVFSRLQARSRFEGTGVGLALCRKIVEHHGGTIGVESAGEGQGCLFWFELPVVNAVNTA
ncbi:MAG: PAS domain-containing sensor histidine kinase [Methylobacter sp.]